MYVLPTGPRGVGEVLDSVFKLFGASFGKLLPFSIAAGLIGLLPIGYLFMSGALEPQEAQAASFGVGAGYWIAFALTFPLTIILIGASIARAEALAQGTPMTIGEAAGIAARRVLTLILASICLSLVLLVGFALLVIPGLILMISLYMFVPAIVLDRKGSVESLKYSHSLVWGNWWRTAGIVTIAFIIVYVLYLLMGLVAGLMFMVTGVDMVTAFIVEVIATLIAGIVTTPFFVALYVELYRDLKMRKLGSDLEARIAAVGGAR